MKRIVAFVLAIIATFSLCACGGNNTNVENQTTKETEKGFFNLQAKPTEEEEKALSLYNQIVRAIHNAEDGYMYLVVYDENSNATEYYNQEAIAFCAEQLQQLECVDKWVGTEYCLDGWNDPSINWNRQELLDRFVVVEDVLLKMEETRVDKVGNVTEYAPEYTKYDIEGQMIYGPNLSIGFSLQGNDFYTYQYDENGKLWKSNVMYEGKIQGSITSSYDENGRKVCDECLYAQEWNYIFPDNKLFYTYDSNDRLIYVDREDIKTNERYRYWQGQYDESGYLINEEWFSKDGDRFIYYEYTYSNNNQLVNVTYSSEDNTSNYTITLDEFGRILTEGSAYTYTYGNYYILKPAN